MILRTAGEAIENEPALDDLEPVLTVIMRKKKKGYVVQFPRSKTVIAAVLVVKKKKTVRVVKAKMEPALENFKQNPF